MKKSLLKLFFNFLIFAVLQVCFFSCQNFLKGTDLKESIDEKIESSKRITIKPEFNEEVGRIRINNKDVQVGQEIELTFLPTEHYIFINWAYDKEYLEFENANSEHTFATVKKYATEIKIEGICKLRNESDHEKPVIKVFRVGLTKESVMSESGKHFATDDGIFTATEIDRSQIIGAKEDNKVWVYCELEDNAVISKATLKEYFIQSNDGNESNVHLDIPLVIENNNGKVTLLFEHTLKTNLQGIYKFGIDDVFDGNNNKADPYLKANEEDSDGMQYYCVRHTYYDFERQGQIIQNKKMKSMEDNNIIYMDLEKDFITKNCLADVDVKFEVGVDSKKYDYKIDYDEMKELREAKPSPDDASSSLDNVYRYTIDLKEKLNLQKPEYSSTLFFKVTVRDWQNNEKTFETLRYGDTTLLYNAEYTRDLNLNYARYELYVENHPTFIKTQEILPLEYPYKQPDYSPEPLKLSTTIVTSRQINNYSLSDYIKIKEISKFNGIKTVKVVLDFYGLRNAVWNTVKNFDAINIELESGGLVKQIGFNKLADVTKISFIIDENGMSTLEKVCTLEEDNDIKITDCRMYKFVSESGGYKVEAYYYNTKFPDESKATFEPGWDKENLEKHTAPVYASDESADTSWFYEDDLCKNELSIRKLDPTFQYGYVEKPRGTLKKAVCYYKPLDEIAVGFEDSMYYTSKEWWERYQKTRPYSPLKLIDYGLLKKEDVYTWKSIDLNWETVNTVWRDDYPVYKESIKVPLLQFPENQLVEVFIWCEVENNGVTYECMDGFQIRRKTIDEDYQYFKSGNYLWAFDRINQFEYKDFAPKIGYYYLIPSYYSYDKTNKKWSDKPKFKLNGVFGGSYRISWSFPDSDWCRVFYTNTNIEDGVGVDLVTVRPCLMTTSFPENYKYSLKNYIETPRGFICYFDKPTMMETFISDVNHGDDVNAWEKDMYFDKLNSKLITSSLSEPASYEVNLADVKPGQYYTVIIHYSDGETEVTTVHQK